MQIHVIQDDIDNGLRVSCRACPIALAIKRQWPGATHVSVTPRYVRINKDKVYVHNLPLEAQAFIRNFDYRETSVPCVPFSFELPDELTELTSLT